MRYASAMPPPTTPVSLGTAGRDYASPALSALTVYGANLAFPMLVVVVLGIAIVRLKRKERLAARSEQRAKEASANPRAGDAVVHGKVTSVEGEGPAIRIAITQWGETVRTGKNSYKTRWTEIDRGVDTRPFYVTTDAGNEVRIEPDDQVQLVDDLTTSPVGADRTRSRIAELTLGEHVFAFGLLTPGNDPRATTGYRQATALVLRPPRSPARMQLSVAPLTRPYRRAAASYLRWAIVLTVLVLAVQGLNTPYHLARIYGGDETATVTARAQKHTDDEHYHRVTIALKTGETEVIPVETHADFDALSPGTPVTANVTRLGSWVRITLDHGTRVHKAASYLPALALLVVMGGLGAWQLRRRRPWYDHPLLIDEEPGRLEVPS